MMASLDGMDIGKSHIVEIKCPGKEDHEMAKSGKVPEKYYPQLQHQLEVCGMDMVHYFSFDGEDGVIVEMYKDDKYIKKLVTKEQEFWECTQNFTPPAMLERDFQIKNDDLWSEASEKWLSINKKMKDLEDEEKQLRDILICMSNKRNTIGAGIKVSKVVRKGNVDYSRVHELNGVNLESYRKPPTECWKILKT